MYPIIHFTKLSDLLDEITPHGCHAVRINASQKRVTINGTIPRMDVTVTVMVQAMHDGAVLVFTPLMKRISFGSIHHEVDSRRRHTAAWNRAEAIKAIITKAVSDAGHTPRPGIIDMGGVEPLLGEEYLIDSEEEEG